MSLLLKIRQAKDNAPSALFCLSFVTHLENEYNKIPATIKIEILQQSPGLPWLLNHNYQGLRVNGWTVYTIIHNDRYLI